MLLQNLLADPFFLEVWIRGFILGRIWVSYGRVLVFLIGGTRMNFSVGSIFLWVSFGSGFSDIKDPEPGFLISRSRFFSVG